MIFIVPGILLTSLCKEIDNFNFPGLPIPYYLRKSMTLTVPGSLECLEIDPEASRATFSCGKLAGSGKSATVTKETNDLIVPGNPHPSLYYK